jgi:hypothetical protein
MREIFNGIEMISVHKRLRRSKEEAKIRSRETKEQAKLDHGVVEKLIISSIFSFYTNYFQKLKQRLDRI